MKFNVTKTSDWGYRKTIEINTLEELMKFVEDNDEIVLIPSHKFKEDVLPTIEIYDTWRE